jgi:hypothetical protein
MVRDTLMVGPGREPEFLYRPFQEIPGRVTDSTVFLD